MDVFLDTDQQLDFRQLANLLPDIVWTAAPDGELEFVNEAFYRFTGVAADVPPPAARLAVLHPGDMERSDERWGHALRTGTPYENELRMRAADGRYHWFLVRARPLRNAAGTVVRWIGTSTDITEHKHAELLQQFLLDVAERIRRADDDETLLGDMARAIGRQLGLARCAFDDVDLKRGTARVHSDYYAPGLTPGAREWTIDSFSPTNLDDMMHGRVIVVNDASTDPRTAPLFETLYRPAGYISYVSIPLMREGRWVGSLWANKETPYAWSPQEVGLLQEIAERTWLAVERLRHERQLERRVAKRTEQLRETNRQLARSNGELEQFAYIASHDLQEPLRKVRAFAGLLQHQAQGQLAPDLVTYIDKIAESAGRMQVLIDEVLNYSRIARSNDAFVPTDLAAVLRDVLADCEMTLAETKAEVTAEDLPVLEAVPLHMNQLLINLIGNALKFTRPGVPPRIHVRGRLLTPSEATQHELPADGSYCELSIRDNGIGFPAEFSEKIFSIFQRLHPRHEYDGTGIGLALCRKIAAGHGGKIYAEPLAGAGATFYVILPLRRPTFHALRVSE